MKTTIALLAAAAYLLLPIQSPAQSIIPWSAVDMGFVISSSPTTMVKSVVGQGFVGMMTGANTIIETGFLVDTLFRTVVTSVAERSEVPREFKLCQNYPNPFNPSTTIRFDLPHASKVTLKVYNVLGQEVATLVDEERPAGTYDVQFNAPNLSSGMYVYRIHAGDFASVKKLLLLK